MTPRPPVLALYEPDIPQNTGTMLRTCACLGIGAAIVEPAAFPVSDRAFRRAGMDYLDRVAIDRFADFAALQTWCANEDRRLILLTTRAAMTYTDFAFRPDDVLLVGRESAGVPEAVHESADARLRVPMAPGLRSLNVAVSAAMALGELRRQIGWPQAATTDAAA